MIRKTRFEVEEAKTSNNVLGYNPNITILRQVGTIPAKASIRIEQVLPRRFNFDSNQVTATEFIPARLIKELSEEHTDSKIYEERLKKDPARPLSFFMNSSSEYKPLDSLSLSSIGTVKEANSPNLHPFGISSLAKDQLQPLVSQAAFSANSPNYKRKMDSDKKYDCYQEDDWTEVKRVWTQAEKQKFIDDFVAQD